MRRTHRHIAWTFLLVLACCSGAPADVLATYNFSTDMSATTAADVAADDAAFGAGIPGAGVPASAAGRSSTGQDLFVRTNSAYNGPIVTNGSYTDSSDEASVLAADDYVQFSLSPTGGNLLTIESFTFAYTAQDVATNKGPVSYYKAFVRSSIDNYTATIASYTYTDVYGTTAADTGTIGPNTVSTGSLGATYENLSGTVSFRLYVFDGVNSGSDQLIHRFDDVTVNGAVVPEPATLSLLAVGGLAVIRRRRR